MNTFKIQFSDTSKLAAGECERHNCEREREREGKEEEEKGQKLNLNLRTFSLGSSSVNPDCKPGPTNFPTAAVDSNQTIHVNHTLLAVRKYRASCDWS